MNLVLSNSRSPKTLSLTLVKNMLSISLLCDSGKYFIYKTIYVIKRKLYGIVILNNIYV